VWRSLHRVCSALPTETPSNRRLGRRMVEYSWPGRRCIFHRIRVSEHDLGSGLDRKGLYPVFISIIPNTSQYQIPAFYITGWRLYHLHWQDSRFVCWPYCLPWSPRQWNLDCSPSKRSLLLLELSIYKVPCQADQWFCFHQLGSDLQYAPRNYNHMSRLTPCGSHHYSPPRDYSS